MSFLSCDHTTLQINSTFGYEERLASFTDQRVCISVVLSLQVVVLMQMIAMMQHRVSPGLSGRRTNPEVVNWQVGFRMHMQFEWRNIYSLFNIVSYFIYSDLIRFFLIKDLLILDQRWCIRPYKPIL